jgi:hypothetical protein
MESAKNEARASTVAITAVLAVAGAFEAVTVPETQNRTLWAAGAWKEDPYHAVVSLAQLAVPALVLLIVVRLLAWRAPGGPDRTRQTLRAAGVTAAVIAFTLAVEWTAVAVNGGASRGPWAATETVALAVLSVLAPAVGALLVRSRRGRGTPVPQQHDGLGDLVFLCRRVPLLRRWATGRAADWARRRALTVFTGLSVLAAAAVAGAQAVGEHLTDPLLVGWFFLAMTAAGLVFCLIGNALAGFVARPARSRLRHVAEWSVLAGCLGVLMAVAFHDPLWSALASGPLTPRGLAALTLGAGAAASALTAAAGAAAYRVAGSSSTWP